MLKACWLQVVEEDLLLLLRHQGAGAKRQLAEAVVRGRCGAGETVDCQHCPRILHFFVGERLVQKRFKSVCEVPLKMLCLIDDF